MRNISRYISYMAVHTTHHSWFRGGIMSSNGKKRRKGLRWIIISGIILVLVATVVAASMAFKPSKDIDPSKLSDVERGDVAKSVVATGKVEPLAKVEVKSKASGIVKSFLV